MPFRLYLSKDRLSALAKTARNSKVYATVDANGVFKKQYTAAIAGMSIGNHANLQQMVHYAKVVRRCFGLRAPLLTPPWKNDADLKPQKFEGTTASVLELR